jgi:hypothetical protein
MLKKIIVFLALTAIAGGGVAYYFWHRATQIPAWFEPEISVAPTSTPEDFLQERIRQEVANAPNPQEPVKVSLTGAELGQALNTEVSRQLKNVPSLPPLQAQITEKTLEVGTVVDPQMLNNAQLSPGQAKILERVMPLLPSRNQPFYVGIEGQPQISQGQLLLTKNSRIKIGDLSFNIKEVSQRLNIPQEKLNKLLQMNMEQLNLQDLQLQNGEILLEVNPPQ